MSIMFTALSKRTFDGANNSRMLLPLNQVVQYSTERRKKITRDIYTRLKEHPALTQRRRYVGAHKPETPPNIEMVDKRHDFRHLAHTVCPSEMEWRQIFQTRDINDNTVDVFQPINDLNSQQWFYTVMCKNTQFTSQRDCANCCIGIDHRRYSSSCEQKKTFIMAIVRKPGKFEYDWDWIQLDIACDCALTANKMHEIEHF